MGGYVARSTYVQNVDMLRAKQGVCDHVGGQRAAVHTRDNCMPSSQKEAHERFTNGCAQFWHTVIQAAAVGGGWGWGVRLSQTASGAYDKYCRTRPSQTTTD